MADRFARAGLIEGCARVIGWPELHGERSGDYRLYQTGQSTMLSADLYIVGPKVSVQNAGSYIQSKWDQAHVIFIRVPASTTAEWITDVIANVKTNPAIVRPSRLIFVHEGGVILRDHSFGDAAQTLKRTPVPKSLEDKL